MAATLLYTSTVSEPATKSAAPEDVHELKHHTKDGFANPWDSWVYRSAPRIGWEMIKRRFNGEANSPDTTPPTVPVHAPTFLPSRAASTETKTLRATWLGHACYLVEFPSGFRALFDPVFTQRCSPFSWLGPARYTDMPCQIADIPDVDAVIISHSHYDHLSYPTVLELAKRFPHVHFFVGLGNQKWFSDCGIQNVTELDWWEERDITLSLQDSKVTASSSLNGGNSSAASASATLGSAGALRTIEARISCLPCQHSSARSMWDKDTTLWCSWSVTSAGKSVWFAGDTGYRAVPKPAAGHRSTKPNDPARLDPAHDYTAPEYANLPVCPAFEEIGRLRGPFDLGMVPIGAYDPRFIMSPMHCNPYDAVNVFLDTRCQKALAMHWGTWVLTEEDVLEPPVLLKRALKWKGVAETGVFDVVDVGESRDF